MPNLVDKLPSRVISAFLDRCGGIANKVGVYANPTEEIRDAVTRGRSVKLFNRGARALSLSQAMGARARLEENYLYDTRRFANGALPSGEHIFFQNAQGGNASNNGFTFASMSDVETNMDTPGQIAQGKNYVFNQIGVSFNTNIEFGDLWQMLEAGALRYEKQGGQYTLKHGPIKMWPGGVGISGFGIDGAGAANLASAHNGQADMRIPRRLSIPRVIKEKETFAYKYVVPRLVTNTDGSTLSLTNDVIMTIWLWGGQQDTIPV